MKFAIIVPARKGSKTLKRKNLRLIKKKPLIEYTFNSIKKLKHPKFVITNDKSVKKIAKKYKININFRRPEKFSKDSTSLVDTLINFNLWLERQKNIKIDTFVILQATSPLRKKDDILKAINFYEKNKFKSLFSVSESQEHPYETINLSKKGKWNYILPNSKKFFRRQDYDIRSFFVNGAIYMVNVNFLKKNKKLVSKKHGIFFMSKLNSIDIDDEKDLLLASKLI